jgi:glycerol-3-phosphate acyltransferase PlsY
MTSIALVAAYLFGSIPIGVIVTKRSGIDIRQSGSGNIGATNVARVVGKKAGLLVLLLDIAKGVVAVLLLPIAVTGLSGEQSLLSVNALPFALAFCVVLGHCFPVYGFSKGGKGVATALGALIASSSSLALIAIVVFGAAFAITKIVSLASLMAALAIGFSVLTVSSIPSDAHGWILGLAIVVIVRHHANVKRLIRGEEGRFSARKG